MSVNTYEEFLTREIACWGEEYIFSLLDKGYEPVELHTSNGETKWSWRLPVQAPLTTAAACATVGTGRSAALLPFRRSSRLSG